MVIKVIKKPYIIAFFFFLIDLISKQVVVRVLSIGESIRVIDKFFYLTYVRNNGAAWGILENHRIMLLIITVMVLFLINKYINKEKLSKLENFSYGMIIGGIVGNLFDRIVYQYVIDFLDFKILGYDYPVFNFADTFIVVGVILMIIMMIKKEHYEKYNCRRCRN